MKDTKLKCVKEDDDAVRVHVEGSATDVDDDEEGNMLGFKFSHEGLIVDLVDKDGNVVRTWGQEYGELIDRMVEL